MDVDTIAWLLSVNSPFGTTEKYVAAETPRKISFEGLLNESGESRVYIPSVMWQGHQVLAVIGQSGELRAVLWRDRPWFARKQAWKGFRPIDGRCSWEYITIPGLEINTPYLDAYKCLELTEFPVLGGGREMAWSDPYPAPYGFEDVLKKIRKRLQKAYDDAIYC